MVKSFEHTKTKSHFVCDKMHWKYWVALNANCGKRPIKLSTLALSHSLNTLHSVSMGWNVHQCLSLLNLLGEERIEIDWNNLKIDNRTHEKNRNCIERWKKTFNVLWPCTRASEYIGWKCATVVHLMFMPVKHDSNCGYMQQLYNEY